ncbi:MAG: hypothetical protein G01um10145_453 [Microgenomates group bacterium Gr01-1014_5]|nr:MAG: hypothetical protein G01um10145_453 [Microgenomates group bacterium Gr01-1014_5]
MISQEAIVEFKELYFQEYKVKLTDEQALDYGTRLVGLVKAVYGKNLPKVNFIDKDNKKENN